ncbi:MAG TPA: hypothetical protein VGN72_16840 [Tepidisphaeraceae bacterium]|jgi:hypothetical protein|nr:hypothetical protein [Tepidisphaeraceae bacterium]
MQSTRRSHVAFLLAVSLGCGLAVAQAPTTVPATTQPTTDAADPTAAAQAAAVAAFVPEGPTMTVDDLSAVFHLSAQNGFLSLSTDLEPTDGSVFVKVDGLVPGGDVNVSAADEGGGSPRLRLLRFTTPPDSFPNPISKTTIAAISNRIDFSQDSEFGGWVRSVHFIQQIPFDADDIDDPPVKLYVNLSSTVSDAAPVKLQLTAGSFVELQQRHAEEVSLYLVPMFALLQQEKLFAPDPTIARQALLGEATADPDLARQVNELIQRLGADAPAARSEAYAALEQLGEPAANIAATVDRTNLSAEQNSLLDTLLAARLGALPQDAQQLARQPIFLLNCLLLDDAKLRTAAFDRLKTLTALPLEFDPQANAATRRAQALKVRTQVHGWATTRPAGVAR